VKRRKGKGEKKSARGVKGKELKSIEYSGIKEKVKFTYKKLTNTHFFMFIVHVG